MALKWDAEKGEWVDPDAAKPDPMDVLSQSTPAAAVPGTEGPVAEAVGVPAKPTENPILKTIREVGSAITSPIHSPMGTLETLANEVNDALIGAAEVPGRNPVGDFLRENLHPDYQAPEKLAEQPIVRMVPFVKSVDDFTTPEGREHLKEHPSQLAVDALGLLGAKGTPGKRLTPALEKASSAVETVGKVAPKGLTEKVAAATAKAREMVPTARTQVVGEELGRAQRSAASMVDSNVGPLIDEMKAAKLSPEESMGLRQALDQGARPDDPKLGQLYDRVAEWSQADRARKLERDLPESMTTILKDQVEETLSPKMAVTGLGPDQTRAMFDAFKRGEPNPIPEASKAWERITTSYENALKAQQRKGRLFEFDPKAEAAKRPRYKFEEFGDAVPGGYNGVINAYDDAGNIVGNIQYQSMNDPRYGKEIGISMVEVDPRFRRQGVATELLDELRRQFPEEKWGPINPGVLTDEGSAWWSKAQAPRGPQSETLFEGIEPQVYPWRDYARLRRAKARLDRGDLSPEAYKAIVDKTTPGKYEPLLQAQKAEQALALNRRRFEPGFGPKAYDEAVSDLSETWTSLAEKGFNPVYVPREAVKTLTGEVGKPGFRLTTKQPSSLKGTTGKAPHYETDPALMMLKSEYELANQTVVQEAVANVYRRTGGKSYERAVQDYVKQGYTPARAESMVRSNFTGIRADGKLVKPEPGALLVRRDVGQAFKHHFERTAPTMAEEAFGLWMVPTLWMSPMFHVNNIVGGALITGLKAPHSALDLVAYGREAYKAVKAGDVDTRVPVGHGMAPEYTKNFTRASRIEEGGRLAKLWEKIPGSGLVDKSRSFNEFADSWYKTVTYLSEYDRAVRKGLDSWTAREMAGSAAANLMQNWDSFSPIERAFVQRIYPFWGFRKAMLRTVLTYPMDHPFRMHFLYQMSRDAEERSNLPDDWDHLLAIGGTGRDGKSYYVSLKGLDPMADVADIFTLKGFMQNLNPMFRWAPEVLGVSSYAGGVPLWPDYSKEPGVDMDSGMLRRPYDWDALWRVVPQINAFATWAGQTSTPPPDENSPEGWLAWLDRYGSLLRATPGISRRSAEEAEESFRKNLKTWARMKAKAEQKTTKEEAKQPAMAGGGSLKWNPATQTWEAQ